MRIRKTLKKVLAFLCVFSMLAASVKVIPKAQAQDIDPFAGYTTVTLSDFGVSKGTYQYNNWAYSFAKTLTDNSSLAGKKLELYATFYDSNAFIAYGATNASDFNTIRIKPNVADNTITIWSQQVMTADMKFSASDMNITSLAGTSVKIAIALQFVENDQDGQCNDLKITACVNDSAVKTITLNNYTLGKMIAVDCAGATSKIYLDNAQVQNTPEESPENLKKIGWGDFGIAQTTTFTSEDVPANGVIANSAVGGITTLVGTSFRGKLALKMQSDSKYFISYGDYGLNSLGIRITPQNDGTLLFQGMDVTVGWPYLTLATINPNVIERTSFADGNEFELGIDIWEVEDASDSIKDLKINIFINGEQCTQRAVVWENALYNNAGSATKFIGTNMNFFTIKKVGEEVKVILPEAESSPENLQKISWKDFGVEETETFTLADVPTNYTSYGLVPFSLDTQLGLTSLIGTSFEGKIALKKGSESNNFYLVYGDNAVNSHGIRIIPQTDGTLLFQAMNIADGWPYPTIAQVAPEKVNLTSFTDGNAFEIQIDMWAEGNDVKVNLFINDVQCTFNAYVLKNVVLTNTGSTKFIGTNFNLFSLKENDEIKIEVAEDIEQGEQEKSPKDLVSITWSDFGIMEETVYTAQEVPEQYASSGAIPLRWNSDKSLSSLIGTSFRGKVSFKRGSDESSYFISYGDMGLNSLGLRVIPQKNGKLLIQAMDMQVGWPYLTIATLSPKKAGLTSFTDGTVFELGIDMWEVEDNEDNIKDVKINLFINGTQYNQEAYTWENAVYNDSKSATKFLGNNINLNLIKENDEVVIYGEKPDYGTPIKPNASLKEISFSSFGIADGTYDYNKNDLSVKGGYYDPERGKTLNGTLFNGYVNFDSQWGIQLRFGGKTSAWEGIIIVSNGDGKLLLVDSKNNTWCVFTPHLAGVQLTDNLINLKMSIVYVDSDKDGKKDDVQVGVWFNDVLYKNQYIYMTDYVDSLGSMFGIYSPKTGVDVVVKSVEVDNSIDFSLFGFDKNHDDYIKKTGKPREVYIRALKPEE